MMFIDWLACSHCLWNNRTFGSSGKSTVHQGHQRCTTFMQILHSFVHSCLSCNRNLQYKPWRRKFISQSFSKWTLFNAVSWMTLLLLLTNYFQQMLQILVRAFSVRKSPGLPSQWGLLFFVLFGRLFSLPLATCQDNLRPTPSVKSMQLPNTMVYVGSSFVYNISEEVFDCEVESFVVSETADRFLSDWLAYNSNKRQLYGVPLERDEGIYNILVVALSKNGGVRGRVCGSRSFFIKVVPVSEELLVSVYPGRETSSGKVKTAQHLPCVPGTQVIHGTLILNVDVYSMNGHERMMLLLKMADHLDVHSSKVSFFSGQASHPLLGQLDNAVVIAAGAGDGRFTKGSRSLLTWQIGCGAIRLEDADFSKLETNSQDGSISSLLGVPVVGWHVMSGTQKNMAKHRMRRQVIGMTATPLPSSAPPSRISNMSTSVIMSRTVAITSVFSNSTVLLSTTAVSSVVPNRTEVSSFTISVNTTTGSSQLPSSTDIQSPVFFNVTSSAILFSPTSIINSSTVMLSRNTTVPVQSSALVSSVNRTTLIMPSSILIPPLNATFITRTATITSISLSDISSLSLLSLKNSSSISPNETAAVGSTSSAVPSVNSAVLTSPAVPTSSLNLTLRSLSLQVSSSQDTRMSSFTASSSKPSLMASSRVMSSASPYLSALSPYSVAISTLPLNVTISTAMPLTTSRSLRQSSPTVNLSNSFVPSSNLTVQEASSAVNQTSLSKIAVTSNSTSLLSTSFSVLSPSSLVDLETTTFMGNVSTLQLNSTAASSILVPTLGSIISTRTVVSSVSTAPTLSTVVPSLSSTISPFDTVNLSISSTVLLLSTSIPMLTSIEGSANKTSSLAVPSFLPSSLTLPLSSKVSSASSVSINMTSVIHATSSSIQMNVTSASVMLSLMSSPIATSANSTQTSMVISMDTSTTKKSALVNSTSVNDRSLLLMSLSSSTRPSGSRIFSTIFATNRTVIATSSFGVNQSIVNVTATPFSSSNFLLSTLNITSALITVKMSSSSLATMSSSPASSFELHVNSTAVSRTQELSTDVLNSSVFTQVVLSRTITSSMLLNASSDLLNATLVISRPTTAIVNSSGTLLTPSVNSSLTRSSTEFSSSLVTSSSISQTLMPSVDTSKTLKTTFSLQNSTTMLRASSGVSSRFTSTLVASSSFVQGNSSLRMSSSTTISPATVTGIPTLTKARSTSSSITTARTISSFIGQVSSNLIDTSLFTRSTLQTDLKTSVRTRPAALSTLTPHSSSRFASVSTGIPSSVQPDSTSIPVNRTVSSIKETSGVTTALSRNTTPVMTFSSTLVKITSFIAPTLGSRVTTARFSSSFVRISVVTLSNTSTITPSVTQESSMAVQFTPSSSVKTSLIPVVTRVNTTMVTSLAISSISTGADSSKVTESSGLVTHRTSIKGTSMSHIVTPVTPSSFALQSPTAELTQVKSSQKSTSVTSIATIRETMSVKSYATPSDISGVQTSAIPMSIRKSMMTYSFASSVTPSLTSSVTPTAFKRVALTTKTSVTTVLSKVSSSSSIAFALTSPKPQTSSLSATSRRDGSSVTPSPISYMTMQTIVTTLFSKLSSATFVEFTSSSELQTPYLSVTSRLPNDVTFMLTSGLSSVIKSSTSSLRASVTKPLLSSPFFATDLLSSTALSSKGSTVTSLASKLRSSRASTTLYKTSNLLTRVPSSRLSHVQTTKVVSQRSSPSRPSTSSPTLSSVEFAFTVSPVVSAKSTLAGRISTPFMSTLASRTLPSNFTRTVTPTETFVSFSVTPSSSVIIPTTVPANSPPHLYNNLGRVSAPAGKALYFTIPDDTFYDAEDQATTRRLSVSVSLANGTSIPSDFWLQFDNTSQTIYGLPLSEHVPSGVFGEGFLLRAQDSQGAEALDAFEVFVVPSEKPIVQELKVRITNDFTAFSRNVSERLLLLQKIAIYYGDSDEALIRVLSFTSGSVVMAWTNDSLPTDRCDVEKVDYVANKVLLSDGQVREEFRDALRGFPVENASQRRLGVCNGTDKATPLPPGAQSTQDEGLWYKHVLVGVFVVFVVIVSAVLLIWYCRRRRPKPSNEKRTFKKRKPIVLGSEIELKPIPGKPLVLPDDDPSLPPSYISETSLDKPVLSDEDEVDYGKGSPLVVYEPPPPFHTTLADDPRNSPPPAYFLPPMY